jgi:argininosuccinate lyase
VYKIVGKAVNELMEKGLPLEKLRQEHLTRYAEELGTSLSVNEEDLLQVLDPHVAIQRRSHRGGPSEVSVKTSMELFAAQLAGCKANREAFLAKIQDAVRFTAGEIARVLGASERVSE